MAKLLLFLTMATMIMFIRTCHAAAIQSEYQLIDPWGDETSLIQWGSTLKITCVYSECLPDEPKIFHIRFDGDLRSPLPPVPIQLDLITAVGQIVINSTDQLGGYYCGHEYESTRNHTDSSIIWIRYITCAPPSEPSYVDECGIDDDFCYHIYTYPNVKKRCGRDNFRAEDQSICIQFRLTTTKPICSQVSIESPPHQFDSHCDYLLKDRHDQHDVVYSIPSSQSDGKGRECADLAESFKDQLDLTNTQRHINLPQLSVIEEGITVAYGVMLKYSMEFDGSKGVQMLPFWISCIQSEMFQWNLKDQSGQIVTGMGNCSQPIFLPDDQNFTYPLKLTATTNNNATAYVLIPEESASYKPRCGGVLDVEEAHIAAFTATNLALVYLTLWYVCKYFE